jgi:transcriptional regulator with XRE-family HTH domain
MAKEIVTGVMDSEDVDLNAFGTSLALQRVAKGYTSEQFAKLLGFTTEKLEKIEAGVLPLNEFADKLTQIAVILHSKKLTE